MSASAENHKSSSNGTKSAHSPTSMVNQLRDLAQSAPVFQDVFKAFSVRERTRQQVTMENLYTTMTREGKDYTKEQYATVLKALANLGVGTLDFDKKKRLRALKNIKITLQSIGRAALGTSDRLDKFMPDPQFSKLPEVDVPRNETKSSEIVTDKLYVTALTVNFDGGPVTFKLPRSLTAEQISELLAKLYSNQ